MTVSQSTLDLWPIGNCQVSGLIDDNAGLVWGCVPQVDGDPVFCSLLGGDVQDRGVWRFELEGQVGASQSYVRNTPILVTRLEAADGSAVASCRMYDDWQEIYDGYTKSVWSAVQPTPVAYGLISVMTLAYVAPPFFALFGPGRAARAWGIAGYASGVAGRYVVARRTGERIWPDVLLQPVSIATFATLITASLRRHRAGNLTWRGRPLP